MKVAEIPVELGNRSYPIIVGSGNLSDLATHVIGRFRPTSVVIITHDHLWKRFGRNIAQGFEQHGLPVHVATVPAGERSKGLSTVARLHSRLASLKIDRKGLIVALGGGVIGDLAGFVAATYLRGVRFVQAPTTLLAQVDASIGGKTGVDLPEGKNLVGAFHQPLAVIIDVAALKSLSRREMRSGLAEVVKYGIIADKGLFDDLQSQKKSNWICDPELLQSLVTRSCEIKARVVSNDETEQGLRAILNFGHTVGHALEAVTNYRRYKHGEAVAIGMVAATRLGLQLGVTEDGVLVPLKELLEQIGLPTKYPTDVDNGQVMNAMLSDKKTVGGKLNFVIPVRIGVVRVVNDVPGEIVLSELSCMANSA